MKLILAGMISFLLTTTSHAFTFNNSVKLVFAQDEVPVNVAAGFCSNIGIDENELLSIVGDAVDQFWNQAPTSRLKLRKGIVKTVAAAYETGDICVPSTNCDPNPALAVSEGVLITCNSNSTNFPSPSILGITIPNNISGKTIVGALIMINDRATTQFAGKSRAEKVAIVAHELGHAFGLGHSPVPDSLMYYATVDSRVALGRDDIDGISYLYPKKHPGGGCGSITDISKTKGPGNMLGGLSIGLFLILVFEIVRRKSPKLYT